MQPGVRPAPANISAALHNQGSITTGVIQGGTIVANSPVTLTSPPANLQMARKSRPWRTYGRIVGLVILLLLFEQCFVSGWILALSGDALYGSICVLFSIPLFLITVAIRRPRVVLLERAIPHANGQLIHPITSHSGSLQTPNPTVMERYIFRDDSVLDVPSSMASWIIFGVTILVSTGLWVMFYVGDILIQAVSAILLIPVIIIGFSIPVMAWWSHSTKRIGLPTKQRDAESWLIAGMLSGLPAIFVNSWLFPVFVILIHPDISLTGLENLTVVISAPVGEEICKAIAVGFFATKIKSPRHGFQVGFTVGLGFAILENLMYIGGSGGSPIVILIRGIGSIPGHAFWTGLSGSAIGWHLMKNRANVMHMAARMGHQISQPNLERNINWKLVDSDGVVVQDNNGVKQTGFDVDSSGYQIWMPSQNIITKKPWISLPLPKSIPIGLMLAMSGHATWNGISIMIDSFAKDAGFSPVGQLVISLGTLVVMIGTLLVIGTGLLHGVRQAPDGQEIDQYQSQLAELTK